MRYGYRSGHRGGRVPAAKAAKELERIRKTQGLKPIHVVDAARPEDAVLHPEFEWRDDVAAESYRLEQARRLIRAIVTYDDDQEPVRIYAKVVDADYERMDVLVTEVDRYALALKHLQAQVREAETSLNELKTYAQQGADPDRMARIGLAIEAASAFRSAIEAIV